MHDHELLTIGRERLDARPSNLGLSRESVAYRTHAPVVSIHRDSDALSRSNFAVILRDLEERHGDDETDGVPDVTVERFRDWLVGWTEHVLVRVERPNPGRGWPTVPTDAWRSAVEWLEALRDYPVADEDHYSSLEYDELVEYVGQEVGATLVDSVVEFLHAAGITDADHLSGEDFEEAIEAAWLERAGSVLEDGRRFLMLREAGDGQLTLDGDVVTVPAPPSLDELDDVTEGLPWSVARVVEDTDTYGQLLELRDVLAGSLAAA